MDLIRYKESAREKLLAFQKESKNFSRSIPLLESGSLRGKTMYLEKDNIVHGIASVTYSELHPNVVYLHFVAETEELVRTLYEGIGKDHPSSSPHFQTKPSQMGLELKDTQI